MALAIFLTIVGAAMNTLGPFLVKLAIDQHIHARRVLALTSGDGTGVSR